MAPMTLRTWMYPTVALGIVLASAGCGGGGGTSKASAPTTTTAVTTAPLPTTPTTAAPIAAAPAPAPSGPCGVTATPPARYEHVVWIWMENKSHDEVIGNADAPYETSLARECGTATAYAHVGKPSLPNYIGATSGDTHGISNDDPPSKNAVTADNLFRQVRASGRAEKSYEESMPGNCALKSSGTYAVKHNPGAYYEGEQDRAACESNNVPLGSPSSGALATDLDTNALPAFSLVTPDQCSDTHDCPVSTGDEWLKGWVPRILASPAYTSGTTAVFVVWDESTPMPNIIISPSTRPGTVMSAPLDHYSLLRTTEELLGITSLLGKAASATSMRPAFGL